MKEFVLSNTPAAAGSKIDYRRELNDEQLDVVLHGDGPCLVLAGAGSGKTRTITYRVAYLIEHGVAPSNILLVTFTNKAAKEMMQRVEALLGAGTAGLWGGTFHSVANRILRQYASRVGRTSNFTILDEEDAKDLVKLCIKDLGVNPRGKRFPSPANLHHAMSYARNAARSLADVIEQRHPNFFDLIPTIERVAELYETRKKMADAMDFDDLLLLLRDLLAKHADVRERLAAQFRYVLVDEYQDTNVVQAEIVRHVASVHRNVLVVGDDAQSIYSFRAAEIQNILRFPDAHSGARVFRLTTNYRSTPEILGLANAVIKQNRSQFPKQLRAVRDGFDKPNLVPAGSTQQEAQYIAEQVLRLRDEGVLLSHMAVLFRAAFLSQALEFELMKRDVPYEYRGGMKFFERAHVKDVVSHVRIFSNPKDEMAWMRVLGLQPGIGLSTASKVFEKIRSCDALADILSADLALGVKAGEGWSRCCGTLRQMQNAIQHPSDIIRAVVASGYREYLEAEYPDFRERLDDLEQFALFAESSTDVKTFLDEVSLTETFANKARPPSQGGPQGVADADERLVLSTIHQAKGLEWDTVFLLGLTDNAFPNPRALEEDNGVEEERRLFYVAATRARRRLFLTYAMTSGYSGGAGSGFAGDTLSLNQPSMFLRELPRNICEEVRLRPSPARSSFFRDTADDEATIVLDASGERATKTAPRVGGFLRNIDEL